MYDFLKKIPLFSDLPQADLDRLCEMVEEVFLSAGEVLFTEGSMGDRVYVIETGQIEIIKHSGGREVLLAVRQSGEVFGELALLESVPRTASARARTATKLLAISHEQLDHLLNTSSSAARAMLHTVTARLQATSILLQQSEKMAQLGTLTAGIAHELNNPASAASRGAQQLKGAIGQLVRAQRELSLSGNSAAEVKKIASFEQLAQERASNPFGLDTLDRSDRQFELETWLEEHGVDDPWELAPILVDLGIELADLDEISALFQGARLASALTWVCALYTIYFLMEEVNQGAKQITEIVKALKMYVYLDQAPVQTVNLHESLDNTIVLLRGELKKGIKIQRDYAPDLPKITAYGSELNQVWTNLIDNAADAMEEKGELIIRTRNEDPWVVIEIEDNGPGIPEDIQPRIFDPFFTTKPLGQGTGLGLNISYNIVQKHGGEIKVFSHPGKTIFKVRLPIDFKTVQDGSTPVDLTMSPDDEILRNILETTRTVAVVGISDQPDRPSYSVPAYLQSQGYRIIPINPNLESALGERAYPDLLSVPESVDTVLIFRKSEAVPEIVEQAIQIGAQVVWMQEGIVNQAAAAEAQNSGLQVVMDTCMRIQHKRLLSEK